MISDGIEYERRCAMLQVEGDGEDIYGVHDCVAVVNVAAWTERVELHNARSDKRVNGALSRKRTQCGELNAGKGNPCTLSKLL